jgi:hypothetical protein
LLALLRRRAGVSSPNLSADDPDSNNP